MSKLKIAIQKSGRLNEDSLKILKECGITIDNGFDQLKVTATNFPLEVFFKKLRYSSIFGRWSSGYRYFRRKSIN